MPVRGNKNALQEIYCRKERLCWRFQYGINISVENPSPTVGTLHGMISLTSGLCSLGAFEFDNTRVPVVMVVTVVK